MSQSGLNPANHFQAKACPPSMSLKGSGYSLSCKTSFSSIRRINSGAKSHSYGCGPFPHLQHTLDRVVDHPCS